MPVYKRDDLFYHVTPQQDKVLQKLKKKKKDKEFEMLVKSTAFKITEDKDEELEPPLRPGQSGGGATTTREGTAMPSKPKKPKKGSKEKED